ncbi:sigma-70 family RNA polymerase sigma factor [candidate division FCPU426 bacterium]|nr:sigma-70 family RNA polymerase sigma factor [candidate division FCPU426 bacterium]
MPYIQNHADTYVCMDDERLIQSIRQDDPKAADELIRRYYQKVVKICRRYLCLAEDVADAAQEVFTKVLAEKKVLHFRGQSQFWTWLFRIASNTCKSMLARKKRTPPLLPFNHEPEWEESAPKSGEKESPEQKLQLEQQIVILYQVLDQLPKRYQRVLELIYWQGLSYGEAARCLNVSAQVLGVHLMRGRHMLQKIGRLFFDEKACN